MKIAPVLPSCFGASRFLLKPEKMSVRMEELSLTLDFCRVIWRIKLQRRTTLCNLFSFFLLNNTLFNDLTRDSIANNFGASSFLLKPEKMSVRMEELSLTLDFCRVIWRIKLQRRTTLCNLFSFFLLNNTLLNLTQNYKELSDSFRKSSRK